MLYIYENLKTLTKINLLKHFKNSDEMMEGEYNSPNSLPLL